MRSSDGLTRDEFGKRTDKTGKRDLTFSKWHRKFLCRQCYATDIDFYEYRYENNQIVSKAFLEVKQCHVKQQKYLAGANTKAIFKLAQKAGVRFFVILYELIDEDTLECNFWVWEPTSLEEIESYDESKFSEFFHYYSNAELKSLLESL